ncbi:MAG: hypothetical protein NVS2B11_03490 [Acetobacteraceae bacterium]
MTRALAAGLLAAAALAGAARAQPFPSYRVGNGDVNGAVQLCVDPNNATRIIACLSPAGSASATANASIAYTTPLVGTASTTILAAAATSRTALDLWNMSGRFSGTAADVWCIYGVPAVLGQGFPIMGGGANVTRNLPAVLDNRALNCIAATSTTLNVGVTQQ